MHRPCSRIRLLAMIWLATIVGCASDGSCRAFQARCPNEARTVCSTRSAGMTPIEVMRLIHGLPPWPRECRDYTQGEWSQLLVAANRLQCVDPAVLEIAFRDYIIHFATSFEAEDGMLGEWSKVFVLLRVMFVEPEDTTGRERSEKTYGGFATVKEGTSSEPPGRIIEWDNEVPTLNACRLGYGGPPYDAVAEFRTFLQHRRMRSLQSSISSLELSGQQLGQGNREGT